MQAGESAFGGSKFMTIIAGRKQMPIGICRDDDRGMPEAFLHQLKRQFEPSIGSPVDAPAGIEMPQRMEPRVFALPARVHDAGSDLRRPPSVSHDVFMPDDAPTAGREHEPERARRASQLPFAKRH